MPALDNPRWEQFCQWIVAGKTQIDAYSLAFGNDSRGAAVNASDLIRKEQVSGRLAELRKSVTDGLPVLTLQEKRAFLAGIVRTAPGQIDENDPLCQSFKKRTRRMKDGETEETIEYALPNKIEALTLDAKLAGELNGAGKLNVRISMFAPQQVIDIEAQVIGQSQQEPSLSDSCTIDPDSAEQIGPA